MYKYGCTYARVMNNNSTSDRCWSENFLWSFLPNRLSPASGNREKPCPCRTWSGSPNQLGSDALGSSCKGSHDSDVRFAQRHSLTGSMSITQTLVNVLCLHISIPDLCYSRSHALYEDHRKVGRI